MASGKTTYFIDKLYDHLIGTPFTPPTTWYLGLTTDIPTSSTHTEVAGNAYVRQAVTLTKSSNQLISSTDVNFPAANPLGWGELKGYVLYDAQVLGNPCYYGELSPTFTVTSGVVTNIPAGLVVVTEF